MDGKLIHGAIDSLRFASRETDGPCEVVYVLDGPVGSGGGYGVPTDLSAYAIQHVRSRFCEVGEYETDAAKRTGLLKWVQHEQGPDTWAVVLDSDELLLWGQYLADFLRLSEQRPITAAGGFPIRLVEFDGSVSLVASRVYKLHALERYEVSVHTVVLKDSETPIALPNEQVCYMHGVAMRADDPRCRPPLQGEPHILHRTMLRDPRRTVERQHEAESRELGT